MPWPVVTDGDVAGQRVFLGTYGDRPAGLTVLHRVLHDVLNRLGAPGLIAREAHVIGNFDNKRDATQIEGQFEGSAGAGDHGRDGYGSRLHM